MARPRAGGEPRLIDRVRWGNLGRLTALLAGGLVIGLGARGGDPPTPPSRAEWPVTDARGLHGGPERGAPRRRAGHAARHGPGRGSGSRDARTARRSRPDGGRDRRISEAPAGAPAPVSTPPAPVVAPAPPHLGAPPANAAPAPASPTYPPASPTPSSPTSPPPSSTPSTSPSPTAPAGSAPATPEFL